MNLEDSFKFLEIFEILKGQRDATTDKLICEISGLYQLTVSSSHRRYREITQILDTIILDVDCLQYAPQAILLSLLFCVLLLDLNIFTPRELINYEFENSNLLMTQFAAAQGNTDDQSEESKSPTDPRLVAVREKVMRMDRFVSLFSQFLEFEFKIQFEELIPTRDFICSYAGGVSLRTDENRTFYPGEFNPGPLFCTVSHYHF